jgi:hypothetical protein
MKYLMLLMALSTLISCKREEVSTYQGEDGLVIYQPTSQSTTQTFSFALALKAKPRDTFFLDVRITGKAAKYPRTISFKAGDGTTARKGIDYLLPDFILPADSLKAKYPVVVFNTPEMINTTYVLVAEIAENKDFKIGALGYTAGLTSYKSLNIEITNQLVKPSYWQPGYFGTFSRAKFRFMIDSTGLTNFSETAIGINGLFNLPVTLRRLLAVYEAANGPLIDENGLRVTF